MSKGKGQGGSKGKAPPPPQMLLGGIEEERAWSKYQRAILDAAKETRDNLAIEARAGGGKTTLIEQIVKEIPAGETVLVTSFSRTITAELKARMPKGVDTMSLHGLGYNALMHAYKGGMKENKLIEMLRSDDWFPDPSQGAWRDATKRVVSRAKAVLPVTLKDWFQVVAKSRVKVDDLLGPDEPLLTKERKWEITNDLINMASRAIKQGLRQPEIFDYDDMLYTTTQKKLSIGSWHNVLVDESQDLSPVQIEMLLQLVTPESRVILVGDPRQAIFSFRGADSRAFPRLIEAFHCRVMSLPITYRCPRAVVELAKQVVPDFEASPTAQAGRVEEIKGLPVQNLCAGDFVLSRKNAPILRLAFRAIQNHLPVAIAGRDLIEEIRAILQPILKKTAGSNERTIAEINRRYERKIRRALKEGEEIQDLLDEQACLVALCSSRDTPEEAFDMLDRISKEKPEKCVVFSSVHRAKGLERKNVYVLRDTFKTEFAGGTGNVVDDIEEGNLWYVAITRSKQNLFLVSGES